MAVLMKVLVGAWGQNEWVDTYLIRPAQVWSSRITKRNRLRGRYRTFNILTYERIWRLHMPSGPRTYVPITSLFKSTPEAGIVGVAKEGMALLQLWQLAIGAPESWQH